MTTQGSQCHRQVRRAAAGFNTMLGVIERMEIKTTLPEADVEQIVAAVRSQTDEQVMSVADGDLGPEVRTGRLYGHIWQVRRAPSGWRVLFKHQWAS